MQLVFNVVFVELEPIIKLRQDCIRIRRETLGYMQDVIRLRGESIKLRQDYIRLKGEIIKRTQDIIERTLLGPNGTGWPPETTATLESVVGRWKDDLQTDADMIVFANNVVQGFKTYAVQVPIEERVRLLKKFSKENVWGIMESYSVGIERENNQAEKVIAEVKREIDQQEKGIFETKRELEQTEKDIARLKGEIDQEEKSIERMERALKVWKEHFASREGVFCQGQRIADSERRISD